MWSPTSYVYDGQEHCPEASVDNLVEGDICQVTVTGAKTDAGDYYARAVGLSNANYRLPDTISQIFVIEPAEINLSVFSDSWAYGDSPSSPVVSGVSDGMSARVEYKLYTARDSAYTTTVPTQAGSYNVRASIAATRNYRAATAVSVFEISPLTAELAWQNLHFVYDGQKHLPSVSVSNLVGSDSCTVSIEGAMIDAGIHRALATKLSNDNYVLGDDAYVDFEIEKAQAIGSVSMQDITYGDNQPKGVGPKPVLDYPDKSAYVTYLYKTAGGEETSYSDVVPVNVGRYDLKAIVEETTNYKRAEFTTSFEITKRKALIEWSDETSFVYDGKEHGPVAFVSNLVAGDSCEPVVEGAPQILPGQYEARVVSLSNDNYTLSNSDREPWPFEITKASRDLSLFIEGWTYGEAPHAPVIEGLDTNSLDVADTQEVTISYAPKGTEEFVEDVPTQAGDYVVRAEIRGSEEYADTTLTQDFSIAQKTARLAWKSINFTYDGNPHVPSAELTNLEEGDVCDVSVRGAQTNAGEYSALAYKLANANYQLPQTVTQTFMIKKADIAYVSKGYSAVRDSKAHGISVSVSAPKGARVTYGTSASSCKMAKSPTYKADGSYTVYFKIDAGSNYNTVIGKEIVFIMPKPDDSDESAPDILTNKKGSFATFKASSGKAAKRFITLKWKKVKSAVRYIVYANRCDANERSYFLIKIGQSKKTQFKLTNLAGTKLDKGTFYKMRVVAYNEDDKAIGQSVLLHVTIAGSKWKNYKSVKVLNAKKLKTIKKGKKKTIKAIQIGKNVKQHVGLRYESTNKKVVKVNKKGVIKAVGKGKAKVFIYTQNGKFKAINVRVK